MKESSRHVLPKLTIILGGAASGKSAFAEKLVVDDGRSRVYLATAQAYDVEMELKIADHRRLRGDGWTTVEAPLDLPQALTAQSDENVILLDCATMWLSNILLDGRNLSSETERLLASLAQTCCPVVVVTNEVGMGIVPDNALARRFRNAQGQLNQALAAQADLAVAVMAGLPVVLKGRLP